MGGGGQTVLQLLELTLMKHQQTPMLVNSELGKVVRDLITSQHLVLQYLGSCSCRDKRHLTEEYIIPKWQGLTAGTKLQISDLIPVPQGMV